MKTVELKIFCNFLGPTKAKKGDLGKWTSNFWSCRWPCLWFLSLYRLLVWYLHQSLKSGMEHAKFPNVTRTRKLLLKLVFSLDRTLHCYPAKKHVHITRWKLLNSSHQTRCPIPRIKLDARTGCVLQKIDLGCHPGEKWGELYCIHLVQCSFQQQTSSLLYLDRISMGNHTDLSFWAMREKLLIIFLFCLVPEPSPPPWNDCRPSFAA